jgi:hypothetical protein
MFISENLNFNSFKMMDKTLRIHTLYCSNSVAKVTSIMHVNIIFILKTSLKFYQLHNFRLLTKSLQKLF